MLRNAPMYMRQNKWQLLALPLFLAICALGLLAVGIATDGFKSPADSHGSVVTIHETNPVSATQGIGPRNSEPYLLFTRDCGDTDTFPCVTFDENEWRMVTGYAPNYRYVKLHKCTNEGGGKNLPCVYVSKNKRDITPFYVYTYDVTFPTAHK